MTLVIFEITPVAKPRMTQSDKWQTRPATSRYWAFKDELQLQARQFGFTLSEAFKVSFCLPMPASWSKAKRDRMLGSKHAGRPDLSNLLKAVEDSLLPDDDSGIWFIQAQKTWAIEGMIAIENLEVKT